MKDAGRLVKDVWGTGTNSEIFEGCADCTVDLEIIVSALQLLTSLQMEV